ncbi:hypothetical protein GCM10011507_20280 [Edaphobacter acidisoli]|uniref:Tetratricopeptide repeat protein n=1 Tax=Edaphobacter acidisoli TaxID=2040573 RepID=A0A916RSY1_9BACT|nr:HEAT repeat domain-containing protein [Edaphobacter acidisoli]GGA68760.1 hypothetical protein GCM10011507_20280 [Edaphobacter acidisoli]
MNTFFRTVLLSPALLLTLAVASPTHALAAPSASSDADYAAGTRAMNQQRWSDAIADFDKVINAHGRRADAALYWKAYSLNRLGNRQIAIGTCDQLLAQFPDSHWNRDCKALALDMHVQVNIPDIHVDPDIQVNPNVNVTPEFHFQMHSGHDDPNEDIKMLALNSLLRQDPAKALPILRNILADNKSSLGMKHRAIFILAQNKSPEAQSILHDAVIGKMDPGLQREAIQSMAVFEGKSANNTLAEVYRTTSDPEVKRAVINAFFITQDAPRMVELARSEKNLDMKRDIVSRLALMHDKAATDYMLELLSK